MSLFEIREIAVNFWNSIELSHVTCHCTRDFFGTPWTLDFFGTLGIDIGMVGARDGGMGLLRDTGH
jgi:hypothetical protein